MTNRTAGILLSVSFLGAMLLSGCSANFEPSGLVSDADSSQTPIGNLVGSVHGGNFPVTGAQIYLFATGTGGYGTASTSLITAGKPGVSCNANATWNGATYSAFSNACYVTTDANGNFGLSGDYGCTAGQQVYMVALGGNPGLSVTTPPPFSTTATFATNSTTITVASATGITTGQQVSGTGIAANSTVTAVNGRTITLSQRTTARENTAVTVTFTTPPVTVNNPYLVQMAGLGQCPSAGNLAAQDPFIDVDEITTVAFAYAMGGFAKDEFDIATDGTAAGGTAIQIAMANSQNIVDIGRGMTVPSTLAANSGGTLPVDKLTALADVLATCVNTTGALNTGSACHSLLQYGGATFTGTGNSTKSTSDESQAMFSIVHNPANNVLNIYNLIPTTPVWPTSLSQPADWTMPVIYRNAVSSRPGNIAFDSSGNAWISDRTNNAVVKVTPQGVVSQFSNLNNGSSNGSIYQVAVDPGNNVWALDYTLNQIYRLDPTGSWLSTISGNQLSAPVSISFDKFGDAMVLNSSNTEVSRFSSSGAAQTPQAYNQSTNGQGSLGTPVAIAADSSGNSFIPANGGCACVGVLPSTSLAGTTYQDWSGTDANGTAAAIDGSDHMWQAQSNNTIVQQPTYASNSYQYYDNSLFGFQLFVGYYFDATNFFLGYPFGSITPTTLSGGGLNNPNSVAFDGNGYIWAANAGASTVSGFNGTTSLASTTGFQTGSSGQTYGAAPDPAGNLWTVNGDGTVIELLGLAAPTAAPVYPSQVAKQP